MLLRNRGSMKRIAFVAPWYGDNIPGGAEAALRGIDSSNTCLHAAQDQSYNQAVLKGSIGKGDDRQNNQRRQNSSGNGDHCSYKAGEPIPDQDGSVNSNGTWGRLSNRSEVKHFLLFNPVKLLHKLFSHQWDDDIPSAKGKGTEIEGGVKQFSVKSEIFFQSILISSYNSICHYRRIYRECREDFGRILRKCSKKTGEFVKKIDGTK